MDWGNINPKQGDETGRGGPNDERDDSRSPRDDSDSKTKGAVVWGSPRSEEGWNTRKLSDPISGAPALRVSTPTTCTVSLSVDFTIFKNDVTRINSELD